MPRNWWVIFKTCKVFWWLNQILYLFSFVLVSSRKFLEQKNSSLLWLLGNRQNFLDFKPKKGIQRSVWNAIFESCVTDNEFSFNKGRVLVFYLNNCQWLFKPLILNLISVHVFDILKIRFIINFELDFWFCPTYKHCRHNRRKFLTIFTIFFSRAHG